MEAKQVIFYLTGLLILTMGFFAVSTKHIFRAAISLLFTLIGIAGLYFLMELEFLAAVQIIVYVGGIVVLIIFSIFLTHKSGEELPAPPKLRELAAYSAAFFGFAFTYLILNRESYVNLMTKTANPLPATVLNIGTYMTDLSAHGYVLPFEVVSFLLLAAMIGAIVIALRAGKKKILSPEVEQNLRSEN